MEPVSWYATSKTVEFTVQEGKLWFLQTRNGKRTGAAMVKIAMDLLRQGMIDDWNGKKYAWIRNDNINQNYFIEI